MDNSRVNAIVPLALLEAVKDLDRQGPQGVEEHRKLGASTTVLAQIGRYRELVRNSGTVDSAEACQLFELVCRRPDASLLLSVAGRGAAHEALLRIPRRTVVARRFTSGKMRSRLGAKAAARLMDRTLGVSLVPDPERGLVATLRVSAESTHQATSSCDFYGVAIAEILRALTGFTGALTHDACCTRGQHACVWHTGNTQRR